MKRHFNIIFTIVILIITLSLFGFQTVKATVRSDSGQGRRDYLVQARWDDIRMTSHEKKEEQSSSLEVKVTSIGDNTERTDFIDLNGNIAYAEDKHYATLIKTKDDHSLLEEFFDEKGEPACQTIGHYAICHEYDDNGNEIKTTYLDKEKRPMRIKYGYSIVTRTYNEEERPETEHYFDGEGLPTPSTANAYGLRKEYDENGRNSLTVYLDINDCPVISKHGYAFLHRTYYESGEWKGKVKKETYGDEKDNPISLSLGQYGVRNEEYDSHGWASVQTYLDRDNKPMLTNRGYATIKKTLYENGGPHTIFYYDLQGNPIKLSEGQYGILIEDGKTFYLNKNGNKFFNLNRFLQESEWNVIVIGFSVILFAVIMGRKANVLMLPVYIACIIYMTILTRNPGSAHPNFDFLWSYRKLFVDHNIRIEITNNILLFMPFGVMIYKISPRPKMLAIPILVSIMIETVQLFTGRGVCEFDDVISNSLGAVIGYFIGKVINLKPQDKRIKTGK